MVEKVVLYLLNCALFNTFFVYRTLNTKKVNKFMVQRMAPQGSQHTPATVLLPQRRI